MAQEKFWVNRVSKTKGRVEVGTYDTKSEAEIAMAYHFFSSSKRGKFCYVIEAVQLVEVGGVTMIAREIGTSKYRREYSKEELMEMYKQEFD